jgi:hypothetical protein
VAGVSDDLEPLSTRVEDYLWIDVETRSTHDVTVHGAFNHTAHGNVTIVAYAVGDGEVKDWCVSGWGERLNWAAAPADLAAMLARVRAGEAWMVAHNAQFEALAFTRAMDGLEDLRLEWLIDSAVQSMRSHLPADLAGAARAVGLTQKQAGGKALIKMFADAARPETPQSHPAEWEQFRSYARDDVAAMRDVFQATMPLSRRMWQEYWASERINHRGVAVDLPFVRGAAALAARLAETANADIVRLTGGKIRTVRQNAALLDWIRYELRHLPEVDRILTREVDLVEDDEGEMQSVPKYSLGRGLVEALMAYLERVDDEQGLTDAEWTVLQVLEVRLFGASATPAKFQKILDTVDADGRLKGQYVYGGAAATIRFSSKGVQCVTGEHEVLTREGWVPIRQAVGSCEIMAWDAETDCLQWQRGIVHSFGPAPVARVDSTMIKGVYTWDHRIPQRPWKRLRDTCPHEILTRRATNCVISARVAQPDAPFTDAQLRLLVAMQSDGTWSKRSARWHFTKERKVARLSLLLDQTDTPYRTSQYANGNYGVRVLSGDVPEWLTKDFGPYVLSLSARQAQIILDEYMIWDGWSHAKNGALCVSSPRKDQMQWLATVAALAGQGSTLTCYISKTKNIDRYAAWRFYLRSSRTTTVRPDQVADAGVQDVFCPTVPAGYWLCRYEDRIYITGNTHNMTRDTVGPRDDELDAIELIAAKGADAYDEVKARWGYVGKVLSRLIRPSFVAPAGRKFAWCDLSSIEAVVCPWLTDDEDAEPLLDAIRANHRDPSQPDMYKVQAAKMLGKRPEDITKAERQSHGKTIQLACIAEGQIVLTDQGEVPIEKVSLDMKVWDGVKFVSHQGLLDRGVKDVWEYQGLVATLDHIVWTEEAGQTTLERAARSGAHLLQSGAGGTPIRTCGRDFGRTPIRWDWLERALCPLPMRELWARGMDSHGVSSARKIEGLRAMYAPTSDSEVAGQTTDCCAGPLHEPIRSGMASLRWARDRVSIRECDGGGSVDNGTPRSGPSALNRPDQQRRTLRAGQSTLGDAGAAELEQAYERPGAVDVSSGRVALRVQYCAAQVSGRLDARADTGAGSRSRADETQGLATYRGKARVYDLLNCGPRNRFTVSGKLVHNCQFLGGKGSLFNMGRIYRVHFEDDEAQGFVDRWRAENKWAVRFGERVWEGVLWCMENPGEPRVAGRITLLYDANYRGGSLFAVLPNGDPLVYTGLKWREVNTKDKETGESRVETRLTAWKGRGVSPLWKGEFVNNFTQATAAALLRRALWRLDREGLLTVVMHTHDEICVEVDEGVADAEAAVLMEVMKDVPDWAPGLPIAAESTVAEYYTKTAE